MSTEQLRDRARTLEDRDEQGVPEIKYVASGHLSGVIKEKFEYIVTCHMAEHTPDLIAHLEDVRAMLEPGGTYLCLLPDKRRCFDRFLPETTIADLISAHIEGRTKPTLQAFIEHRAFTSHDFDSAPSTFVKLASRGKIDDAVDEYYSSDYPDAHCWKLTPESAELLIRQAWELGFLTKPTVFGAISMGAEFGLRIRW